MKINMYDQFQLENNIETHQNLEIGKIKEFKNK